MVQLFQSVGTPSTDHRKIASSVEVGELHSSTNRSNLEMLIALAANHTVAVERWLKPKEDQGQVCILPIIGRYNLTMQYLTASQYSYAQYFHIKFESERLIVEIEKKHGGNICQYTYQPGTCICIQLHTCIWVFTYNHPRKEYMWMGTRGRMYVVKLITALFKDVILTPATTSEQW